MDVRSEAHVESEVPADVIGIVIDHHAVAVPIPIVTIVIVGRSNIEVIAIEPEAVPRASGQHPDVPGAEAALEMAMLPGMFKMIVPVFTAAIVADPPAVAVDVGSVRMVVAVAKMALFRLFVFVALFAAFTPVFLGATRWNVFVTIAVAIVIVVPVAVMVPVPVLAHSVNRNHAQYCQQLEKFFHVSPM